MREYKPLREQFIETFLGRCVHFNGVMNNVCEAGVAYDSFRTERLEFGKPVPSSPIPCLVRFAKPGVTCAKMRIPTREEAEKEADEQIEHSNKTMAARFVAAQAARGQGFGVGCGGKGWITCPICGDGTLHYAVAEVNGHMRARCTTSGCVNWIE